MCAGSLLDWCNLGWFWFKPHKDENKGQTGSVDGCIQSAVLFLAGIPLSVQAASHIGAPCWLWAQENLQHIKSAGKASLPSHQQLVQIRKHITTALESRKVAFMETVQHFPLNKSSGWLFWDAHFLFCVPNKWLWFLRSYMSVWNLQRIHTRSTRTLLCYKFRINFATSESLLSHLLLFLYPSIHQTAASISAKPCSGFLPVKAGFFPATDVCFWVKFWV